MPMADETREEALKRLDERAAALQARAVRPPNPAAGEAAVGQAYRIIAELLGGVLIGLAVGAMVDGFAGTGPWGMIGGVLLGFVLSIFLARRTANRLMAQARAEQAASAAPGPAVVVPGARAGVEGEV